MQITQVIEVFTYSYDGGSTLGIYSTQELADAQIRRWVALENAKYEQINAENEEDEYQLELYVAQPDANVLTFKYDGEGISSRVVTLDAPIELTVPPWLKDALGMGNNG